MNFFSSLLAKHNLSKHDGRPLWKYFLNEEELSNLTKTLRFNPPLSLDPRDVALYYAQWWKKNYDGGKPSKQEVFESLGGNIQYRLNKQEFYEYAVKGAQMLGVKWIKKQNILRFKTLLLQGGLPLKHISNNQGNYKAFLEAVLEEQPESIEDFIFKNNIINLLPKSSQNDTIYENCLEIVKSILNNDGEYDKLLDTEDSLKEISSSLRIKRASLSRKDRQSKPKNYWLLSLKNNEFKISLRLGLANIYKKDALSDILGIQATERSYQFFIDDSLICIFRKMANNNYKTDWYNQDNQEWNSAMGTPNSYVIANDEKIELKDFIQTTPNMEEPSLWSLFSEDEWRMLKGYAAPSEEAAVLYPSAWRCDLPSSEILLHKHNMSWLPFEGEIKLFSNNIERIYLSGINSFDWTIQSKQPNWMLKSNMPVVQGLPKVLVYDDDGYDINRSKYKVSIRNYNSKEAWEDVSSLRHIKTGCFDLRIEKGNLIAQDIFFNIGNLKTRFSSQSIHSAIIDFQNLEYFECKLYESELIGIHKNGNSYELQVNTEYSRIPTTVKCSIGCAGQKKLYFDLNSPFQGMVITDSKGQIINEDQPLSLANLYGMRILSTHNNETLLKITNNLKPDVKITKEIKESTQPVISFKDEIVRLFYLADAMDFKNSVCLELSEGRNKKRYSISGFSHTLNIQDQLFREVRLFHSNDNLDLFAVPVNCKAKSIEIISLLKNEDTYTIPNTSISNQFIIFSSKINGNQLMPRFVNTGDLFIGVDKNERIENYHKELLETTFLQNTWQQVLTYFNICVQYDLPFSTFDQLRAISRSSEVASMAFLFLGINQSDFTEYIQKELPEMEKDLGFCFHWVTKTHWEKSITETAELIGYDYYNNIIEIVSTYMEDNGLQSLFRIISGSEVDVEPVLQSHIRDLRAQLGARVLDELPYNSPKITSHYSIQIEDHNQVRLLIQSPIAVAESINDIQNDFPLWAGDEKREVIRRNIQYSQYLKPDFYNKIILHALNRS